MASSSIWSMNLQPAYTRSPGQPSAYLCPKSEERTCLTVRDATFSLATSGRLSENHLSCCFTREISLPCRLFTMVDEPVSVIIVFVRLLVQTSCTTHFKREAAGSGKMSSKNKQLPASSAGLLRFFED